MDKEELYKLVDRLTEHFDQVQLATLVVSLSEMMAKAQGKDAVVLTNEYIDGILKGLKE